MYFNHKGLVKLKIGIAKGKKVADKRETSAKRDWGAAEEPPAEAGLRGGGARRQAAFGALLRARWHELHRQGVGPAGAGVAPAGASGGSLYLPR